MDVAGVARGGTANLIGAAVYGLSGFVLLIVLNRGIGVADAGVVVVAIAIFNILTVVAGLGTATGLVRTIARLRALGRAEQIPHMLRIALTPVAGLGVAAAAALWFAAPWLANLFTTDDNTAAVTGVLRAMAPFVPIATLHATIVQATRGFDTMLPQVMIEKIGRSVAMPIAALLATVAGLGPRGVGVAWAATNVVALVASARSLRTRVRQAVVAAEARAGGDEPHPPPGRAETRAFWAFTAPRAVAQTSNVAVNWLDTVIVGAILSTTAAGIYASGTRYLQPGLFASDALVQVTSPRLSALLSTGKTEEASMLVKVVAGWQTAVMWPIYLLVVLFPTPLLQVFGPEVVAARGALIWLSLAMLVVSPLGPTGAVILMAGRSLLAMGNTLVVLAINVIGNLLVVRTHGITGAGAVWALSILVNEGLTGWQSNRSLRVRTLGRPAFLAVALAAATVGVVGAGARLVLGDGLAGLTVAGSIGGVLYLIGLRRFRSPLHLDTWWSGVQRSPPTAPLRSRASAQEAP
ncbi:MAG: oligosaccharide flippase family protein [Aquihabitans sp.]